MSILKFLGVTPKTAAPDADTETVRRIVVQLEALEPHQARYLAAFAYILARVAYADEQVSDDETQRMEQIVTQFGGLTQAQSVLLVQIAKSQAGLFGGTEDFLVTRQFRDFSKLEERVQLLHCLFAVSAADDSISSVEEQHIREIASELGFSTNDFVAVRLQYSDKRAVLRNLPGGS